MTSNSHLSESSTPHSKMDSKILLLLLLLLSLQAFSNKISASLNIDAGVTVMVNGGTTPSSSPASTSSEYTALQAWKSAITEDPAGITASWVGPNVCNYGGVFCSVIIQGNSNSSVVSSIDLNHANIKGILVKELSMLTHLSIFHLNSNRFSGTVPDSFRNMQYLRELDLSSNQFSGPFPTSTLLVPNLVYLDLRFNSFSGEIPDELFMKDLDAIFLNNNQFEGEIPMSLWASSASVITLANNELSGSVPTNFGYMGSGIREILFLNNKLTGCIPEGVGYLDAVEVLDFSYNSLTGHLPSSLTCLSEIEVLNLAHNQLSGELSELVCDLKNLLNLTLSYNFFSGFSQDCSKSTGIDLSGNCIPGKDMQRSPAQCMDIPGGGLSCLRIPAAKEVACTTRKIGQGIIPGIPFPPSSSLPSVLP